MPMTARRLRAPLRCLVVAGLVGFAVSAAAQSCTVSASGTSFGAYNPFNASPTDSNGTVTLTCAAFPVPTTLPYTVSLSTGASATYAPRRMAAGARLLPYQLYTNAVRSIVWGDGSAGTSTVTGNITLNAIAPTSAPHTVYGRIPALQTTTGSGAYADVVIVTVTY
jgi:spore coat protein U-like protein